MSSPKFSSIQMQQLGGNLMPTKLLAIGALVVWGPFSDTHQNPEQLQGIKRGNAISNVLEPGFDDHIEFVTPF